MPRVCCLLAAGFISCAPPGASQQLQDAHTNVGALRETCAAVHDRLDSGQADTLSVSYERFAFDGTSFDGCVIRLVGELVSMSPAQAPETLFGPSLNYCPNGVRSEEADVPGDEAAWCADRQADGPDGTSYRAFSDRIFCLVESHWDGGDDSDPLYEPDPRYETVVRCALR